MNNYSSALFAWGVVSCFILKALVLVEWTLASRDLHLSQGWNRTFYNWVFRERVAELPDGALLFVVDFRHFLAEECCKCHIFTSHTSCFLEHPFFLFYHGRLEVDFL